MRFYFSKAFSFLQHRAILLLLGSFFCLLCFMPENSFAVDYLKGMSGSVKETISGSGKVLILLAEGVVGAVHYIKSRNMLTLIGYPLVMLFTAFVFAV